MRKYDIDNWARDMKNCILNVDNNINNKIAEVLAYRFVSCHEKGRQIPPSEEFVFDVINEYKQGGVRI